jgi:glycosyltransferase involved in cell wall biosynthesis
MPGGVANFYRKILPHLGGAAHYLEVGAKTPGESPAVRLVRMVRDYRLFYRELKTRRFGVVVVNPSLGPKSLPRDAAFILLAQLQRIPVVVFFRGWDDQTEKIVRRRFLALFRATYLRAAGIVVLGGRFEDKLRDMGYRGPILRSSTAVEDSVLDTPAQEFSGRTGTTVVFLGRLERAKGVFETLDAVARLRSATAKLIMAGDGPDAAATHAYARDLGLRNVTFLGHIEGTAKHQTMIGADVFVLLSHSEGMPNSILEAMAYGLPVITTATGGVVDFFRHGEMGYIVENGTAESCAGYLRTLLSDAVLRNRMGTFNRDYARRHFKASTVAANLLVALRSVASR